MEPESDKTRSFVPLTEGTMVGHYKITGDIGAGGMGEVYLAEDTKLNRRVALKFLLLQFATDEDFKARFTREARAAAALDHPNIVTIHEVGEYDGQPFFAMQYVEGRSLRELIEEKGLSIDEAVAIVLQICEGLKEAAEAGIVHRDIKPSNIILNEKGRVKILDFGLARPSGTTKLTKTGSTFGTLEYMSPEQAQGKEVDQRSDLFAVGVVLYEMLTCKSPFSRQGEAPTINAVIHDRTEPLARYKAGIPDELQRIVSKLLEKDPETRYQTAAGIISDLKKLRSGGEPGVQAAQPQLSIAVLPFANLSADPEQEYFCDGMAEEIINALTHIENLRVIARTSAFTFKGKSEDVREIGRKLDVGTLLEGSVRKAGNRLRITAQLIRVSDGSHLWSERYDREMEDVFAIQDEISLAIVDKLRIKLLKDEKDALIKYRTKNVEAYNLYLMGRHYWNKRTPPALHKAIEHFEHVIEKDPDFALAYSGLADCYSMLEQAWELPPTEAFPKAKAMALKALEKDGTLAEGYASLALVKAHYDWDWPGAERDYRHAIELNPGYPTAHHWYAIDLMARGQMTQAVEEVRKAQELDPLSPIICVASAWIHINAQEFAQAEEQGRKALEIDPDFLISHMMLGMIYEQQRIHDQAIEKYLAGELAFAILDPHDIETLRAVYRKSGWTAYWQKHADLLKQYSEQRQISATAIAQDCMRIGDIDQTFEWLERAFQRHESDLIFLAVDWIFSSLYQDPRFNELLRKVGLA